MPCRDGGPIDYVRDSPETIRRLNLATRVACEALQKLDDVSPSVSAALSKTARDWWRKHQEEDRRRQEAELARQRRETLRTRARAKLTPEERKALGI